MINAIRPRPSARRAGLLFLVALAASFGSVLTMAHPVVACSCVGFTSWKEAVTPETAVFSGTAGQRQARGVPVRVERWLRGKGAAPTVWLSAGSFNGNPGVSSSCGVNAPPAGSSWVWVAYPGENGDLATGLCSPAADLATGEGRSMLQEAVAAFGGEAPLAPEPTPNATADAAPAQGPADLARDRMVVLILGGLLLGSLALFGGLVIVARRSRSEGPGAGR